MIQLVNFIALVLLFIGLYNILRGNFKWRDRCFLSGTVLLTVGAVLQWIGDSNLKIFAFVLLFSLQVLANILQLTVRNEKSKTTTLFILSLLLFLFFFLTGLFEDRLFFIIALGAVLTGFAYKESPEHTTRQSILLMIAALLESVFAYATNQYFYIYLNIVFIIFGVLIIRKNLKISSQASHSTDKI